MNDFTQTLLRLLTDGQFHSGTALGQQTGRTRTAVWKAIQSLQQSGMEIYSVRGKGYRLAESIELLHRESILSALDEIAENAGDAPGSNAMPDTLSSSNQGLNDQRLNGEPLKQPARLHSLDVFHDIKSTNAYLLNLAKLDGVSGHACLAEQQRAGRGRRGRNWVSPFGGNLYLSLLWQFNAGATQLGGLSLAVAVAVLRALHTVGLTRAGVKWPNDIIVNGRKLAGILLELSGEASGPCAVVMGVGLNIRTPKSEMKAVKQPWTDLESELGVNVARNALAAQLIHQLMVAAQEFELKGLQPFLQEWAAHDVYVGCEVTLQMPQGEIQGTVRGVDDSGALLLMHDGELQRFHSGDVSLWATEAVGLDAK